jgi:hypothetical protein
LDNRAIPGELLVPSENVAAVFFVAPAFVLFVAAAVFFPDVAASVAVALVEALYAAAAALFAVVASLVSVALPVALSGFPDAAVAVVWLFSVAIVACYGGV